MTATISNSHSGYAFEQAVLRFLSKTFPALQANAPVDTHLIPKGVEIWEYDARKKTGKQVYPK